MILLKISLMKPVADYILSRFENEKELYVKSVYVPSTIGFNQSGNGNVQNAVFALHCEAGQLWNQQNCHSINGIYAWPS